MNAFTLFMSDPYVLIATLLVVFFFGYVVGSWKNNDK
jgi:hypothetical protein